MKYKVFGKTKLEAQLYGILKYRYFHYPHAETGPYKVFGNGADKTDSLLWAYKCWIHQMEKAEPGYGLEEFFANQDLSFDVPKDFQEESDYSLAACGDLMAVDCMCYEYTEHLFDEVKDFLFNSDLTCANLESTVYDKAPIGRNQSKFVPARMNTSVPMFERFVDGGRGINYFATANNHTWDYKEEGVLATLDVLDTHGVYHSGSNRTKGEQDDVLIIEKNGIKTAMLNWTFDLNGYKLDENQKHFVNEVRFDDKDTDMTMCYQHIQRAKEKGADLIVATVHWGWEFEMYPHKKTVDVAHELIEAGVDVIIGGHPHVAEPMEKYTYTSPDGEERTGLIIYSLGDFVTYHPLSKDSKLTYVVRMNVKKGILNGKKKTIVTNLKMMPVYILCEEKNDDTFDCRLLKFYNVLEDEAENYHLDSKMRKDVPRLERLLYKIVLPRKYELVLQKNDKRRDIENMSTIAAKFAKLGIDSAPGQEGRQREVALDLRGEKLNGVPVDFSHGDVDAFLPLPGSKEAFDEGFEEGGAQAYTEYRGRKAIREEIAEKLSKFTGAKIDPASEIILTPGTQGALFLAMGALVGQGDKVAIVEPDYFANRKLVEFFDGELVGIPMDYFGVENGSGIDLGKLEKSFQEGVKLFLFSNPNNPTGAVYSYDEIVKIAALAKKYDVALLVDELYSRQIFDGKTYTHLRAQKEIPNNLITILGPSKTESLSGFRLGTAFGSADIIYRMEKLQAIVSLRCAGYCQAAFRTWFSEPEGFMNDRILEHQKIRDEIVELCNSVPGVEVRPSDGGSYLFIELPKMEINIADFVKVVRKLADVTVTPGTEFGPEFTDSFRINFSQDHQAAVDAMKRLFVIMERYRA